MTIFHVLKYPIPDAWGKFDWDPLPIEIIDEYNDWWDTQDSTPTVAQCTVAIRQILENYEGQL